MVVQDYFQVRLGDSLRLALPMSAIETVLQVNPQQICPIPGLPSWLLGVVNRRGILTWVLNLSQFLDVTVPTPRSGKDIPAVVVTMTIATTPAQGEASQRSIACLVGELSGVFTPTTITQFSKPLKPKLRALFSGVTQHQGRPIALVDPAALLHSIHTQIITTQALAGDGSAHPSGSRLAATSPNFLAPLPSLVITNIF